MVASFFARFMHKHCDADLEHILASSVPPLQLDMVTNLRSVLFRYQRSVGALPTSVSVLASYQILAIISFIQMHGLRWTNRVRRKRLSCSAHIPCFVLP